MTVKYKWFRLYAADYLLGLTFLCTGKSNYLQKMYAIHSEVGQRWEVISVWLHKFGGAPTPPYNEIAKETKHNHKYVKKWIDIFKATNDVQIPSRTGNSDNQRVFTRNAARHAANMMLSHTGKRGIGLVSGVSSNTAAKQLHSKGVTTRAVHATTVQRGVRSMEKLKYIILKAPKTYVSPQHMRKRVVFCRKHGRQSFQDVMFVDSKYFTARGSRSDTWPHHGWVRSGEQQPESSHDNKTQHLHMYGGITMHGTTPLVKVTGSTGYKCPYERKPKAYTGVGAPEFENDVLKHVLIPAGNTLFTRPRAGFKPWRMMLDGAGAHVNAKKVLTEGEVGYVDDWPPQSADLNPIENVWAWMEHKLSMTDYADLNDFEAKIREVWAQLPVELCKKYVTSMRRRTDAVIRAGGAMTNY
jgi:hypothetical protein